MTDIKPIATQQVPPTGLSQEDITRLPKAYGIPTSGLQADAYESQQESSGKTKSIILKALIAAAAIVGLKHCGFMKVTPESTGFIANFIKKPIAKVGSIIEWPFVKIAGLFKGKQATEAGEELLNETTTEASAGRFKKITGWIHDKCINILEKIKSIFKKKPTVDTTA